jgi:DNA-binding CsgD family transcriptional regulator
MGAAARRAYGACMARSPGARAVAAREAVAALSEQDLEPEALLHEVSLRVRRVVPHDWASWGTTDPETLLETGAVVTGTAGCELLWLPAVLEAEGGDVNHFRDLERSGTVAATLYGATGGEPATSTRYRRLLAPNGLDDELRALARSGHATWAVTSLARASDAPPFSAEEVAFVRAVAGHVGEGLRRVLARASLDPPVSGPAGVIVVGADGELAAATPDGRRWLRRLPNPYAADEPYLPPVVDAVVSQARAASARPARMRVRLPGDGWLHVRAEVLQQADGGDAGTAVTLEPAGRAELLPVLVALHGLTPRERDVAALIVRGLGTAAVAEGLGISHHTLRDHLKAIFAKTGVRSRAELTALLAP